MRQIAKKWDRFSKEFLSNRNYRHHAAKCWGGSRYATRRRDLQVRSGLRIAF
jgi:hypothetical protein